jgi:hypothetical protein
MHHVAMESDVVAHAERHFEFLVNRLFYCLTGLNYCY